MCPTLCDPVECSPPGSSVHGIFPARILERVVTPSGDQTHVYCIAGRFFTAEPLGSLCFTAHSKIIFFKFFLYGPFSKSLLNLLQYYFCLMFCFLTRRHLNSLTRYLTHTPCIRKQNLIPGLLGKSCKLLFFA